ncbi:UNVERIFIED_CONTAM: hypothetical protein DES50_12518 [Williamsia faeni]
MTRACASSLLEVSATTSCWRRLTRIPHSCLGRRNHLPQRTLSWRHSLLGRHPPAKPQVPRRRAPAYPVRSPRSVHQESVRSRRHRSQPIPFAHSNSSGSKNNLPLISSTCAIISSTCVLFGRSYTVDSHLRRQGTPWAARPFAQVWSTAIILVIERIQRTTRVPASPSQKVAGQMTSAVPVDRTGVHEVNEQAIFKHDWLKVVRTERVRESVPVVVVPNRQAARAQVHGLRKGL